MQNKNQFKSNN